MEFTEIIAAIGTTGFPVVMCVLMYINNNKQQEKWEKAVQDNTEAVKNLTIHIKTKE